MDLHLPPLQFWFPRRMIFVTAVLVVTILLPSLAVMYLEKSSSQALEEALRRASEQKTLAPLISDLRKKRAELEKLTEPKNVLPAPQDLPAMMSGLQKLTDEAKINNSQFMPVSESVLKNGGILIKGRFLSSSKNFCRLLLALSDQSWIMEIVSCTVKADARLPEYELTLLATFNSAGSPGHDNS